MDTNTDTPQDRLERACRLIEPEQVKAALAQGADADQEGQSDQTPLTIIVALNTEGGEALARKSDILTALFAAGARKDPYHKPDEGIVACGIEALIESAMDRLGVAGWNEDAELELLEAWLEAGNDPNPMVSVDGRIKPLIRSIGYMFDEIKQWKLDGEEAQIAETGRYIHRVISTLHLYGCPVSVKNLDEAGFEPEDITAILERVRVDVGVRALKAGTAPAESQSKPGPRI